MTASPDPAPGLGPDLEWSADGAPRSAQYDDIYFQPGEGLDEARAVFLEGCGLPDAWSGRDRFTVGELGFGSGLNILALLDLWRRRRQAGQRLQVFTLEAHPLSAAQAARVLALAPEVGDLAARLISAWPRQARGMHRIDLPEWGAVIDLWVGEAADGLGAWQGRADAWFLDGFAPARNPQMWRPEVLALVAARSAPGARLATFTVAGAVRRGLAEVGFAVDKRPGHGRKRERLEARAAGAVAPAALPDHILILGGGIAGAALARAAAAQGLRATVVMAQPGASANPAALVTPAFDLSERAAGRLYAQALARAADLYAATAPDAVIACGVLQLEAAARDAARFDRLAASALYEPGALVRLSPQAVADRLGEIAGPGGLFMRDARVVDPAAVVSGWLAAATIIEATVAGLARDGDGWRLLDAQGRILAAAPVLCLAAGAGLRLLRDLPLSVVRGQASWAPGLDPGPAAAWGGYTAPTRDGVLFGATHDRDDIGIDRRPGDDDINLASLSQGRPRLAQALAGRPLSARAALRAATPDRLPLAGRLEDGLFILAGLGGRGFTTAPLLAEQVVAEILDAPCPLPADLAAAVAPGRFG